MTSSGPVAPHPERSTLLVPRRFCGPASSGNGGWTSGAFAALLPLPDGAHEAGGWPPIRVALRTPPPLDIPMQVLWDGQEAVARVGGVVIATAQFADTDPGLVEPVPPAEASAARAAYPGLRSHPFPTCFSCGTGRAEGDGLRIFPGQVADQDGATRVASTWTPHPSLADPDQRTDGERASLATTWAALDCVGGWAGDLTERLMVLAGMTARIDALPAIGEEHVVVGMDRGHDGRKTWTSSTLYDSDGRVVGCAEHLWVAIDPATLP